MDSHSEMRLGVGEQWEPSSSPALVSSLRSDFPPTCPRRDFSQLHPDFL